MLQKSNTALVVIDIQGKLAKIVHRSEYFIEQVKNLIKCAEALEIPMILTEQLPCKLGAFREEIKTLIPDITPVKKSSFSCCENDEFMTQLQDTDCDGVLP